MPRKFFCRNGGFWAAASALADRNRKQKPPGERKTAMKNPIQLTKSTNPVRDCIRRSPWRRGFLLIPLALVLAFFALSPAARAVDPPPDGGYPGFNTAEGENALFNLDTRTGSSNTAI